MWLSHLLLCFISCGDGICGNSGGGDGDGGDDSRGDDGCGGDGSSGGMNEQTRYSQQVDLLQKALLRLSKPSH